MTFRVLGLDHASLTVADRDRSLAFYRDLLGLRVRALATLAADEVGSLIGSDLRVADLELPDGHTLELIESDVGEPGEPAPWPGRSHVALAVDDLGAAVAILRANRIELSGDPVTLVEDGFWHGASIVYARDPDGHTVELIEWPG
ncbi:MAG: VOC family protein [Gaiellales bacterium]